MPLPILNAAAHQSTTLTDAALLRERLLGHALALGVKGTVSLAEKDIDLCVAGPTDAVREWLAALQADARFAGRPRRKASAPMCRSGSWS